MSGYAAMLDMVKYYYGYGSDQWLSLAKGTVTPVSKEGYEILKQVPGVSFTFNKDGSKILGYDYKYPFNEPESGAAIIDSNVDAGAYGAGSMTAYVPATAVPDTQSGSLTLASGARTVSTGAKVATIADKVSLATAGVALGTKLGLAIDSALYNAAPQWWDEHFPSMNPDTWSQLVPDNALGNVIRSVFKMDDAATMYIDQRIMAYAYMAMLQGGAFSPVSGSADYSGDTSFMDMRGVSLPITMTTLAAIKGDVFMEFSSDSPTTLGFLAPAQNSRPPGMWTVGMVAAGLENNFHITVIYKNESDTRRFYPQKTEVLGKEFWYAYIFLGTGTGTRMPEDLTGTWNIWEDTISYPPRVPSTLATGAEGVAYIMLFGDVTLDDLPGVEDNPNAGFTVDPLKVINPTTGQPVTPSDNIDDVMTALQTAYPSLFNDSIYEDIPQPDGTTERVIYVPVPWPNTDQNGNPVTDLSPGVDPQTYPQIDPAARPDAAEEMALDITETPEPPDTGSGETPPAIIPTGSANALYSIYNPTQGEISSFGAWLWSSSFVDQLLKLFSDPMQAIIGLHKVFVTPPRSGRGNIKVGYLDSGVETTLVSGQYVTVDCGSVSLREYFGNVLDYEPYTRIQIYLPFIGIQPLDTGDVMRGTISVKYHVDVLTGACLAEVTVRRDGAGGVIYTYAGNAAVQYPISSGSYMGIFSSALSVAGGIAGTVASGGALAPLAMGAASGIMAARTRVQHSGSFSGNAGAMGIRKPYLIITRPQAAIAESFETFEGLPASHTVTLGKCSGYVRARSVHLDGVPATRPELEELQRMLADGIVI